VRSQTGELATGGEGVCGKKRREIGGTRGMGGPSISPSGVCLEGLSRGPTRGEGGCSRSTGHRALFSGKCPKIFSVVCPRETPKHRRRSEEPGLRLVTRLRAGSVISPPLNPSSLWGLLQGGTRVSVFGTGHRGTRRRVEEGKETSQGFRAKFLTTGA